MKETKSLRSFKPFTVWQKQASSGIVQNEISELSLVAAQSAYLN